jgi:hypothetical protein
MRGIKVMYVWGKIELFIISLWLLFVLILVATIHIPIYFEDDWKCCASYLYDIFNSLLDIHEEI